MSDGAYNRESVLNGLRDWVAEITFTKLNGEQRVMRCTLRADLIPKSLVEDNIESERKFHRENKEVVVAWDMQKGGWRSFRVDSIQYMQLVDAY